MPQAPPAAGDGAIILYLAKLVKRFDGVFIIPRPLLSVLSRTGFVLFRSGIFPALRACLLLPCVKALDFSAVLHIIKV